MRKTDPRILEALRTARALVFDFDGTLVDSNRIKWRGFEACFSAFPDRLDEIMVYCRGNNHTPRWDKFRHVYEEILRLPYTSNDERRLNQTFEEATTRQIAQTPEVPGAEQFLRHAARTHWIGLLSATPGRILEEIVESRGWRPLFQEIQGAPVQKSAWLKELAARKIWNREDLIFFGDTPEDAQAAAAAGCGFAAVGPLLARGDWGPSLPGYEALLQEMET